MTALPDYAQLRFAYAPPRVLPKPAITVRKPEPPLLCAPAIAGLLPAPKAQRSSVAGIMARGEIYITGDSATFDTLCKEMPDSAIPVIRLKPSQMERVPVKNHTYGEGVIALPAKTAEICDGDYVAIDGFSQFCIVRVVFERWNQTWVTVMAFVGKHSMERTVSYDFVRKI